MKPIVAVLYDLGLLLLLFTITSPMLSHFNYVCLLFFIFFLNQSFNLLNHTRIISILAFERYYKSLLSTEGNPAICCSLE